MIGSTKVASKKPTLYHFGSDVGSVEAEASVLQHLDQYLVRVERPDSPLSNVIRVFESPASPLSDGSGRPVPAFQDESYLVDDRNGVRYVQFRVRGVLAEIRVSGGRAEVFCAEPHAAGIATLRLIRDLIRTRALREGGSVWHASLVDTRLGGVISLGDSGAGKTSMALWLASLDQSSFVANDRVALTPGEHQLLGVGVPHSINVGFGQSQAIPRLANFVKSETLHRPQVVNLLDWRPASKSKLELTPAELRTALACSLQASTSIQVVCAPQFVAGAAKPSVEILTKDVGEHLLTSAAYTPEDPVWPATWARSVPPVNDQVSAADVGLSRLARLGVRRVRVGFDYINGRRTVFAEELSDLLS